MFRLFSRAISAPGSSLVSVYESCVSAAKCEKVSPPVFRFAKGVKALGTSSVHLCDKKDSEIPSIQDEMKNPEKKEDPVDTDQLKMTEQQEKPVVLKAVDETVTEQKVEDKSEQVESKQTQVQTKAAKSDKKNLLELLAAMKVDVTSMSRRRKLQMTQTDETTSQLVNNVSMLQQGKKKAPPKSDSLDPHLVSAASAAASTLPNQKQAQSELLQQLLKRKAMTDAQRKAETNNLGEIISDMKIGRSPNRQATSPTSETLFDDDRKKYRRAITSELASGQRRMLLFSGKSLGIFSPPTDEDTVEVTDAQPTLWDLDFEHQISQSVNQLPRNGIEEMIQWTKEGKMWLYPIDNEAGLEEEAKVPFHEHVFLEKHLEGFPRQGPVRHFMELVVAGLSKNPYLTVQQKQQHISWFRDYFNQKEEVLKEADISLN